MPDGTGPTTYTAVTFAPVQSFIRSSRKLRDLYGSSLLLSHLARALFNDAETETKLGGGAVISPAHVNATRGVPNTLLIQGAYSRADAEAALLAGWHQPLKACRDWLEKKLPYKPSDWPCRDWSASDWEAGWGPSWKACERHSWELFLGQGATIQEAEQALRFAKQQRAWEIPNWTGESSTLSSAEAIVRPRMAEKHDPRLADLHAQKQEALQLLRILRDPSNLDEAFAGENEELSLSELIKRLVTYRQIAEAAFGCPFQEIIPERFARLSGQATTAEQRPETIVWFMADGDKVSDYLHSLRHGNDEATARRSFSTSMREWAAGLYSAVPKEMGQNRATVVYAGGDDILGALHETNPGSRDLRREDLLRWLRLFPQLWQANGHARLTVSMGLVWADSQVPQREALQHARDAEASAKARGRDRFALRLLYAGGNHLEWTCPWDWLDPILTHYRDREGRRGTNGSPPKWRHLAEDLLWLQGRHAIGDAIHLGATDQASKAEANARAEAVAHGLLSAYFPGWQPPGSPEHGRRLDQWLLDLGRVMAGLERWRDCPADSEAAA
jgi:CRISPR-associated protein Cmr2